MRCFHRHHFLHLQIDPHIGSGFPNPSSRRKDPLLAPRTPESDLTFISWHTKHRRLNILRFRNCAFKNLASTSFARQSARRICPPDLRE